MHLNYSRTKLSQLKDYIKNSWFLFFTDACGRIDTLYLLYNISLLPFALTRIAFFVCSAFHVYCTLHFRSHRLCHRRRNHLFQLGQIALLDRIVGTNHIVGRFTAGVLNDQLISNEACLYVDSQTLQREQWGNCAIVRRPF